MTFDQRSVKRSITYVCEQLMYFENKPVLRIKTLNYWAVDTYARPGMENMALALTPFDIDA